MRDQPPADGGKREIFHEIAHAPQAVCKHLDDLHGHFRMLYTKPAKQSRFQTQQNRRTCGLGRCRVGVAIKDRDFSQRVSCPLNSYELLSAVRSCLKYLHAAFFHDQEFAAGFALRKDDCASFIGTQSHSLADQSELASRKVCKQGKPAESRDQIRLWRWHRSLPCIGNSRVL